MSKFMCEGDVSSVSIKGMEFLVVDGVVECPDSAAPELGAMGFVRVSEVVAEAVPEVPPEKADKKAGK